MNPFTFGLDVQRQFWEQASDAVETSEVAPERLETLGDVEVGQTPSEVVYEENKLKLLHYESQTDEQYDVPILVVYALINRPYILDLQPDRSVVRRLLEAGFDVYMIDWGEPSQLDTSLTLDDYVNRYVDNCVDEVCERSGLDSINLLGYCMGGTMSVMYASLHPEKVRNLGLMAAGLCFDGTGGVLELWGDDDYYEPEKLAETFGNVPAEFLDVGFALMDPVNNFVTKYVNLYDNLEDEDFVENFARMERWLSDGIDVAGETYRQFLEDIYQENKLYRNELEVGGERVELENVDMPVIQLVGEYDHLIPPEASKPFNEKIGSDDTELIEATTGHIGLSVSRSAHKTLWPQVAEWFAERSELDAPSAERAETEPVAEESVEAEEAVGAEIPEADVEPETPEYAEAEPDDPAVAEETDALDDVERVRGIGPTYAERLEAAGIDTVDALAAADPDDVADAAEVGPGRAGEWIEEAKALLE